MKTTYRGIEIKQTGASFNAMNLEVPGAHTSLRSIKSAIKTALEAGVQVGPSSYAKWEAAYDARTSAAHRAELATYGVTLA